MFCLRNTAIVAVVGARSNDWMVAFSQSERFIRVSFSLFFSEICSLRILTDICSWCFLPSIGIYAGDVQVWEHPKLISNILFYNDDLPQWYGVSSSMSSRFRCQACTAYRTPYAFLGVAVICRAAGFLRATNASDSNCGSDRY